LLNHNFKQPVWPFYCKSICLRLWQDPSYGHKTKGLLMLWLSCKIVECCLMAATYFIA
jgi:hypothetical protein